MHILTFDVEDWFHTFHKRYYHKPLRWEYLSSQLEQNVESLSGFLFKNGIKATFFWLGWCAKQHQKLVRKLSEAGHEIGVHSYLSH